MVVFNPKTKTLFKRDESFNLTKNLTDERYGLIRAWLVTKKMDGMSVILSTGENDYYGRSANTNFNAEQQLYLRSELNWVVRKLEYHGIKEVDIYAELVGPGIQGNPHGLDGLSLYVFDVRLNGYWLDFKNVEDIAQKAELQTVTSFGMMNLARAQKAVEAMRDSTEKHYYEGIVARTEPYLYDNQGNRIMWKLKCRDLK